MRLTSIFKKNGGFSIIKNYTYNHVLLYAFFTFFLVPKNIKGLELFRDCMNLKIYERIKKKYQKVIFRKKNEIKESDKENQEKSKSVPQIIWFCWFQGIENAPPLVHSCYESIKENCPDYEIRIITEKNFLNFAAIPDFIIKKWKKGIITHAHFSDILRTSLLLKNGGIWIDSTVLLTASIPKDIENSSFFIFRTYKPGSNGKAITLSSWFISSEKENRILDFVQTLLWEYWKTHNYLCDYFLFHIFMQIAMETMPDVSEIIPKYTNETPHFLLFELGCEYTQEKWESIVNQSFCHKLTNKLGEEKKDLDGTFYKKIIEKSINYEGVYSHE